MIAIHRLTTTNNDDDEETIIQGDNPIHVSWMNKSKNNENAQKIIYSSRGEISRRTYTQLNTIADNLLVHIFHDFLTCQQPFPLMQIALG